MSKEQIIEEVVSGSKIPGAMQYLYDILIRKFKLSEEELILEIGNSDRIKFICEAVMKLPNERYQKLLPKILEFCDGFEAGLDFDPLDYATTEYLNDR